MSGIEATRRLMSRHTDLKVVVLTVIESQTDVIESIIAGACGYLLKDSSIEDITHAIDVAVHGEALIDPAVATKLLAHVRATGRAALRNANHDLSARELHVLRLLAEGRDNREIAAELFISQSTVKHHVSAILSKLGVGNRIQAAVLAVREGLL
jgi:DNA-binding NarL/FixJ family response regulator